MRQWHPLAQASHVANVLCLIVVVDATVHRVDDGPGAQEQTGFEEGVSEDVEKTSGERAYPDAAALKAQIAEDAARARAILL